MNFSENKYCIKHFFYVSNVASMADFIINSTCYPTSLNKYDPIGGAILNTLPAGYTQSWDVIQAFNTTAGNYSTTGSVLNTGGNSNTISWSTTSSGSIFPSKIGTISLAYVVRHTVTYDGCSATVPHKTSQSKSLEGGSGKGNDATGDDPINMKESNVKISPNPVKDNLTIDLSEIQTVYTQLVITDLLGKEVLRRDVKNPNEMIQVSTNNITKGIYNITLVGMDSQQSLRFVKQ